MENVKDINFKKSLGQNFLFDLNLLNAIATDGGVTKDDAVLEIGAGAGTLTKVLCERAEKVISFEIDKTLKDRLDIVEKEHGNVTIFYEDFIKADLSKILTKNSKFKVVANIPYYITTPIIFKLVDHLENFSSILVLVQKEVAERFASKSNTKDYGITSVILQSLFDVTMPRVVKKECFTPSPKVDSALCLLVPHNRYKIDNFEGFRNFVHTAFSMRRKTLTNNLKKLYDKDKVLQVVKEFGYPDAVRPEQIDVSHFVEMFKKLG
ncbi:MAG: 16S rRNA (adenine(1518)-N(6)/adenine(1519)-N(6))-dimethyltransferase RsmA [Clostridia bacterium]|nr:16S rRNA (adenine(1518)-N(6)/adenine(1519)-N(6))-dimethyltransferase RsmA [Clostridia bacterium]